MTSRLTFDVTLLSIPCVLKYHIETKLRRVLFPNEVTLPSVSDLLYYIYRLKMELALNFLLFHKNFLFLPEKVPYFQGYK